VSDSLILRTATRFLAPLLMAESVWILLRGHNEPGGGFIGGLLGAGAIVLVQLSQGASDARRTIRVDPRALIGSGLISALVAAVMGPLVGRPLLTGVWLKTPLPGIGKLGSPLLFDIGVYLVVVGSVLLMVMELDDRREEST
jgi:multicomponent Na+:H+ antiporter subunit B